MPIRVSPDDGQPSATIEIPLERPLSDYDLNQLEQPTPRDVDAVLVSQGFRDLIDDARGVLLDIIANFSTEPDTSQHPESDRTPLNLPTYPTQPYEVAQLTGAICPGEDEVYRPGLWIILKDLHAPQRQSLTPHSLARVHAIAEEFARRLHLV